ncbi:hypothetical protein BDZ97DRAFT_1733677 [Flammula alnicola]|nr:hypothetical protein BDZ97DRAFT_1733677 [Flammula alnicola]
MLPATTDDIVFHRLSPSNLLRYAQTCKTAYGAVSSYIQRTFQVQQLLSRFFTPSEIHYFRYWQSRTGMFISGSTALQFFDRSFYPDSDLDIYVEHRHCEPIAYWLTSLGYAFEPRRGHENDTLADALVQTLPSLYGEVHMVSSGFFESASVGYFGRGVANVYNFHKYNPDRKIQLITSYHSPLEVVLNFHSTCVMNIITHEKAYSLYPKATFEQRRSLIISTEGSNQETARKKYATRGWSMVEQLTHEEYRHSGSAFAQGGRYVGDSKCWTLPILPKLDLPEGYMETNTWELVHQANLEPEMLFLILLTGNLRYSYLVVDRSVQKYLTPALLDVSDDKCVYDDDIKKLLRWHRES